MWCKAAGSRRSVVGVVGAVRNWPYTSEESRECGLISSRVWPWMLESTASARSKLHISTTFGATVASWYHLW
jgi:hypothetical protein